MTAINQRHKRTLVSDWLPQFLSSSVSSHVPTEQITVKTALCSLNFQQGTFKQSQSSTWKYLWTKSFISLGYYFYYYCCCCCCQLPKTQRSITFRGHTYMTKIRTHLFTDTLHKPNFMVLASRETLATSRKNRNAKTPTPGSLLSPDDICHGSCWHGMCSVTFYIL